MASLAHLTDDLNPQQREAVEWGDGPLLIVAGAGSGKTRVITRRIAHLIGRGVDPGDILAITFTNKAAGEMRQRVLALVDHGKPTLATFHAFCARVLRVHGERVGLLPGYTIYDTDDQVSVIKDLLRRENIDTQQYRPRAVLSAVSAMKNEGVVGEEAEAAAYTPFERVSARAYVLYVQALAEANAADFDDLLLKTTQLFRDHEDVLDRYRRRYRHVLVDEYQDTNRIQDRIARGIADGHGNLCVTGDPDQSIYRWRGARVQNILEFETDYPGTKVVRLEQNYRSVNRILRAASAVIDHNPGRMLEGLWSELGDGELVQLQRHADEESESDAVVKQVRAWIDEGRSPSEIAIFYRTNALSRGLERAMRLYNVPYDIVGAVEFYERKEVKDLLAYLRVLVNPADAISFLRIVNVPTRGIGKTSLDKLRSWALPLGIGPREAARRAAECPTLTKKPRAALLAFTKLLDELEEVFDEHSPEVAFEQLVQRTGYSDALRDYGGQEALERLENVGELGAALGAYARNDPEASVAGFLEETALVADVDTWDERADRITMMTLHAAKGLEFPCVIMVGMEEGLLPHMRSLESDVEIQEERRLCYVGMTRAQERLILTHADRRQRQGQWMPGQPSRFLDELPEEEVEVIDRTAGRGAFGGSWTQGGQWGRKRQQPTVADQAAEAYIPDPDDYLDLDQSLPRAGQAVRHAHFGEGVVLDVTGSGAKARITVRFRRFGDKTLMAEYARLEPA